MSASDALVNSSVAPYLPLIPLLLFPLGWLLIGSVLTFASGWYKLMRHYPDRAETSLFSLSGQSAMMGSDVSMRGILTFDVCPSGLRVSIMRLLSPFSRPFFVPWSAISVAPKTWLFMKRIELQFGNPYVGHMHISTRTADRLRDAADSRWPKASEGFAIRHERRMSFYYWFIGAGLVLAWICHVISRSLF